MAKLPQLDSRLSAALALVREGSSAADIGCDHGKLAAKLAAKCSKVIAIDSRPKPLAHAKALCGELANVECRLGDGLNAIAKGECEYIVIAGLSAESICKIVFECAWIYGGEYHLILVPTRPRHHVLRSAMCRAGFSIDEQIVSAQNRLYSVMHCVYCGKSVHLPLTAAYRGFANGENTGDYLRQIGGSLIKSANGKTPENAKEIIDLARYINTEADKCKQK